MNSAVAIGMMLNDPPSESKLSYDSPSRRLVRMLVIALAGLAGQWGGFATAAAPLTRIAEVRQLPRVQADQALPVHVRGVVTGRRNLENLTIQDDTAGIGVDFVAARIRHLWRGEDGILGQVCVGSEVEIEGISSPGGYAPLILPVSLRILGTQPLPPPRPIQLGRFFSGSDDCQRVEVRGVVQGFYQQKDTMVLIMDANPGRFTAFLVGPVVIDPAPLVDAEIRVCGVASTRFNLRAEATGIRVKVMQPGDLVVEKPPPALEAVPWVSLDQLLPFRAEPTGPHRVRVAGTVTYSLPGQFFYLQEGNSAMRVETSSSLELQPGDRVEAAGFADMARLIGTLRDATVRKTGVAAIPEPLRISPREIRQAYDTAVITSQLGLFRDFDGYLIRCRARLLAMESTTDGKGPQTLTLEQAGTPGQGPHICRALLFSGQAQPLAKLRIGSELEVTGLVQFEFAADELSGRGAKTVPVNLDLILRSASDVRVLSEPSWWTAQHFLTILAALLLALGAALVWSLQLKRLVRRKSAHLAREINARRDAALEFRTTMRERNRLAANLHDTLPQTMSAIGLQLDVCEFSLRRQGIDSLPPLEMIRQMVGYAVNELRGAVWEMRSFSLRGRSFPAALQGVVERVASGHSAKITVHTDGPLEAIPEFVSGNLLLIVQEALRNALQHGSPANISVDIRTAAPSAPIHMVVCDDGSGFTPGSQHGPEQGHCGMVGMMERAERLGGSLRVESAPGQGTRIVVEVSQDAGDNDLANENELPKASIAAKHQI